MPLAQATDGRTGAFDAWSLALALHVALTLGGGRPLTVEEAGKLLTLRVWVNTRRTGSVAAEYDWPTCRYSDACATFVTGARRLERLPCAQRIEDRVRRKIRGGIAYGVAMKPALAPASLLIAAMACGPAGGGPAAAVRPKPPTFEAARNGDPAECVVGDRFPTLLSVDWAPEQRLALEVAMKQGVAVVSYGCPQGLKLLSTCRVGGRYGFVGVTLKEETIQLENREEVAANLPLSGLELATEFGTELDRGATFDIGLVMVGKRTVPRSSVGRKELVGACDGATHFVLGATVGAFAMKTGTRGHVRAVAELFGVGGSTESESNQRIDRRDGSLEACRKSEVDGREPPSQCGALVQIDLAAIDEDVPPSSLVRSAAACPAGLVWSGGHCAVREGAGSYQCAPGHVRECFDQCDKGDQRSCVTLATMLATGDGAPKDLQRAHTLSASACDADVGEGCLWAGRIHEEKGRYDRAAKSFERGCAQGQGQACSALAAMVRDAKGTPRDDERVARLMARGCAAGDQESCMSTGQGKWLGLGETNADRAYFEQAKRGCDAEQGRACARLGMLYTRGVGVVRDALRGRAILEEACLAKNPYACVQLYGLDNRLDNPTRRRAAKKELAALCDDAATYVKTERDKKALCAVRSAWGTLGMAVKHPSTRKSHEVACHHFDHGPGCYVMARMHHEGLGGLSPNPGRARDYFQRACLAGVASGCVRLADLAIADGAIDRAALSAFYADLCQRDGFGCAQTAQMERDASRRLRLLKRGCLHPYRTAGYLWNEGDPLACALLAPAYEQGQSVRKDAVKAALLYRRACRGGHAASCEPAQRLEAQVETRLAGEGCQHSKACFKQGRCHATDRGSCVLVKTDADCQQSRACHIRGSCRAKPERNVCVARSDAECRVSDLCEQYGKCHMVGERCKAKTAGDCKRSGACAIYGRCKLVLGACE